MPPVPSRGPTVITAVVTAVINAVLNPLLEAVLNPGGFQPLSSITVNLAITSVIWFVVASTYLFSFWNLAGQTPAMRFLSIRIEKDGDWRLTAGTAFKRLVGFWLATIPFGLGFIGALLRPDRRAFDDRLADTAVFYVDPVLPGMPHDKLPEEADTRYRRTAAQQAARSGSARP